MIGEACGGVDAAGSRAWVPTTRSRATVIVVLTLILAFNFVDRIALGLMLQDIKLDLRLSDTQLGLLTGLAFAVFYSAMGIPIARWADRGDRVRIIAVSAVLWSAAVALSALTASFLQLLLVRMVVAIGEAGCIPPAHSLMADYFDRAQRPRAMALYLLGGPLSIVIGYLAGGWINVHLGWRSAFACLGAPGLLLGVLAWLLIQEPRRVQGFGDAARADAPAHGLWAAAATLWRVPAFRLLLAANSIISFFGYGVLQWQPAFFIRRFAMSTDRLGALLSLTYGLGGLLGTYVGGALATRYARENEAAQLAGMAIAMTAFGALSTIIYLSPWPWLAFSVLALGAVVFNSVNGPMFATIQSLVPERTRATAIALVYLFANLIGMGLGPLAVGVLSDALQPSAGGGSLRLALLAFSPGYVCAGWLLWRASRRLRPRLPHAAAGARP